MHEAEDAVDLMVEDFSRAPGDLTLSVMRVIGRVASTVILGFALYRCWNGEYAAAAINALMILMVLGALALGRMARFRRQGVALFGLAISAAALLSPLLVSSNGLYWAILVLWVNAVIQPRRLALGFNSLIIVVLTLSVHLYDSLLQQISWTAVAVLMSLFGLRVITQVQLQQKQLVLQAHRDPLTGIGNRRMMQRDLQAAIAERRRGRTGSTLMVLDIDLFKNINDRHGHEEGDRILREFAQCVGRSLRAEDGLYRMGGEEFVVLLRGMDLDTARRQLPELHRRLSGSIETPDGPLQFSAGTAVLLDNENWSRWLARADRALYEAKACGRNRLIFSDQPEACDPDIAAEASH